MLSLNEFIETQSKGNRLIESLCHEDMVLIQNYCNMAAKQLIKAGVGAQQPTVNIVLNAFRNGVCLGLGFRVNAGKLEKRGAP